MKEISLRPRQEKAINLVRDAYKQGHRTVIMQAATGFGKTRVSAKIIQSIINNGKRVLFICDRVVLVEQALKSFEAFDIPCGVMQGHHEKYEPQQPLQICSIQTLKNRKKPHADFVIVDECFIPETEILTENGFIRFDKLKDDRVAQYDNGVITFVKPKRKIKNRHTGNMVRIKSQKLCDLTMTLNHEMLINYPSGDKKIKASKMKSGYGNKIYTAGKAVSKKQKLTYYEKLAIAFQADGSINWESKLGIQTLSFSFSKKRKINKFIELMSEGDFEYKYIDTTENDCGSIRKRYCVYNVKGLSKNINEKFNISDIGYEKAKEIIEYMVLWGGRIGIKGLYYYSSINEKCADFYQTVAILANYKTNKTIQVDSRKESYNDIHRLFIRKEECRISTQRLKKEIIKYDGYVYCVEVPSSNIIVRGNGKPIVIGNCHTVYKAQNELIKEWDNVKFLGVTATAFTKGLGLTWDALIIGARTQELINDEHLTPFVIYGAPQIDLSKVKMQSGDYNQKQLGKAVDKKFIVGDIVKHWVKLGENRQTICSAVNIIHSKHIVEQFKANGIPAAHIDCYTKSEEREQIYKDFESKKYKILSSVDILTKGFDAPFVSCLIMARPTKSLTMFIQLAGRGIRIFEGKKDCILLDHAGNVSRHGFPTDPLPEILCNDEKKENGKAEKKEALPKPCDKCFFMRPPKVHECPQCGYTPIKQNDVENTDDKLEKIDQVASSDKLKWLSMLLYYARSKGYKDGWASHAYKTKMGVWPFKKQGVHPIPPDEEVKKYIQYLNIKKSRSKK